MQLNSYTVADCTSDKEAFLYIRLRMTPQYSIDRSQRRKGLHVLYTGADLGGGGGGVQGVRTPPFPYEE